MFHHHTKTKGDIGLLKAKCDLIQKGFLILSPESEHAPFDLVIYRAGIFQTVQVKYRAAIDGRVDIPLLTSWADKNGNHARHYDASVVDLMCAYCPDTDECYYVPIRDLAPVFRFRLRLTPSANNQTKNIRMAADYRDVPWPCRGTPVERASLTPV